MNTRLVFNFALFIIYNNTHVYVASIIPVILLFLISLLFLLLLLVPPFVPGFLVLKFHERAVLF